MLESRRDGIYRQTNRQTDITAINNTSSTLAHSSDLYHHLHTSTNPITTYTYTTYTMTATQYSADPVDQTMTDGDNPPAYYRNSVLVEPEKQMSVQDLSRRESQLSQHSQSRSQSQHSRSSTFEHDSAPQAGPSKASSFSRRFHSVTSKAGWPLNKAANVIGAEGWWPTSGEKECNKAARILHSFTSKSPSSPCITGITDLHPDPGLGEPQPPSTDGPMHPTGLSKKSVVKIPQPVLQNCAGLAIFNVLRAGAFHGSLAAGSGVVVSRRPDGTWSPPSTFVVTTVGAGFMLGLDVYDCVCVLNTPDQVRAFTNPRLSLGGEASIAVGPIGTGGSVDAAVSKTARPMWSYMKSRGLWAGVQIDGTIIISRADANAVFYNERGITANKILNGDVAWPAKAQPLFEVLRAIEGRADFNRTVVQEVGRMPPPGDTFTDTEEKQEAGVVSNGVAYEPYKDETVMDEKERLARTGF